MKAITVNQRSWHYRVWRFGHKPDEQPTNLCSYFWSVAANITLPPLFLGALVAGLVALVLDLGWWFFLWVPLGLVAGVAGLVLVILAIIGAIEVYERWGWHPARGSRKRVRSAGVVRSYVAARKAKVCPLIQVDCEEPRA